MSLLITLFFSTFVLEDVALGSALALISQGQITFIGAFVVCALGIAFGDLALYFAGRFAARIPFLRERVHTPRYLNFVESLRRNQKMDYAVVISRAVPGTRLPTYWAAGFIKYPFYRFLTLTLLSVAFWVLAVLYLGQSFFLAFKSNWLLALLLFLATMSLLKSFFPLLSDPWARKAALHSWRKWLHFEFWPAWFFYLPIVPYYVFLSLRYRSVLTPFYAGPQLRHGGLIGESKWDYLKFLNPYTPSTLPALLIPQGMSYQELGPKLTAQGLRFPLVAKPDVGQRGFGVRILRNEQELEIYIKLNEADLILQKQSQYSREAGVFYIRSPGAPGLIFSVTDKRFPFVIGDGSTRLGDLILRNPRSRIIATTYFKRHQANLDHVIPAGERYLLSECGNHCQGALFLNGANLASVELLKAIEYVVKQIPDFRFGRIDIRYKDENSLKMGLNFEIIEINGAGSEATHIWDPQTRLIDAYSVLFQQWRYLFAIGDHIKREGKGRKPQLLEFGWDCLKVALRKGPLTVSS